MNKKQRRTNEINDWEIHKDTYVLESKFGNAFCQSDKVEAIYEIELKVSPFAFCQIHPKHSQTRTSFEGKRHC